LKTIRAIPMRLRGKGRPPRLLAVRGEVFLPLGPFQKLNKQRIEQGEEPFANPRNAASGTVRRLDPRIVARTPLDVAFYDVLKIEGEELSCDWDTLARLAGWGLKTDPHARRCKSVADIERFRERLGREREKLDYEIDGIVVKVDDFALREKLGVRHRNPRWALAWKFEPRQEVTTLEDIVVQVGMTGMLTPVALLAPVDVGGVTVSRATLHNEGEVRRKGLQVGDEVRIARAGDVIPEVVERVSPKSRKRTRSQTGKRAREFSMPRKCPSCGTKVEQEGAYWFCPAGLACHAQLVGHVIHYASRRALDIEGLGEKTARQLVDARLVEALADLYALTVDDLLGLEGFAKKSAEALHAAIRGARTPPLDRFLFALGIRHVGERIARSLADAFGSLEKLAAASEAALCGVPDVGEQIAHSVHGFFADRENRRVLQRMRKLGVKVRESGRARGGKGARGGKAARKAGPLAGKTVVFTGTLEKWTRPEAERLVEDLGGRAASSVSKKTDYVVAGESPGSKLDEAKRLGVEVLDERAFEKLTSSKRRTRMTEP